MNPEVEQQLAGLADLHKRMLAGFANVVVGQRQVLEELLITVFAGGHNLLEGVPGLAKTLMISTLARLVALPFKRIQFTPDLMPSDIVGTNVIEEDHTTGKRVMVFVPGPIFTSVLLADEINRTPPKTQAALLQAMQEKEVTAGGKTYTLEPPFFVLATQNPIDQEGTYRLPGGPGAGHAPRGAGRARLHQGPGGLGGRAARQSGADPLRQVLRGSRRAGERLLRRRPPPRPAGAAPPHPGQLRRRGGGGHD